MFSWHLFGAPIWAPRFFVALGLAFALTSAKADEIVVRAVAGSDFRAAHEALVEAIESEGLVVGALLPFRDMLSRTAGTSRQAPFAEAEIVQFCSSIVAWKMVEEAPEQLAFCPLSVALYEMPGEDGVRLSYRRTGSETPARRQAEALVQRIVDKAAGLARLRW